MKGKTTAEVVYGITGLGRMDADAVRLVAPTRLHGSIENGLRDAFVRRAAGARKL